MTPNMPERLLETMRKRKRTALAPISIWKFPEDGRQYILGADPCLGTENGPNAAIQVIDKETGEQCAEFADIVNPEQLAPIILGLAKRFNNAEVAVEVNSVGMVTNNILLRRDNYENIYRVKGRDRVFGYATEIVGWWTNAKTKIQMEAAFRQAVGANPDLLHSVPLLNEIIHYDEDGSNMSDRFSAMMIAQAVRAESLATVTG